MLHGRSILIKNSKCFVSGNISSTNANAYGSSINGFSTIITKQHMETYSRQQKERYDNDRRIATK